MRSFIFFTFVISIFFQNIFPVKVQAHFPTRPNLSKASQSESRPCAEYKISTQLITQISEGHKLPDSLVEKNLEAYQKCENPNRNIIPALLPSKECRIHERLLKNPNTHPKTLEAHTLKCYHAELKNQGFTDIRPSQLQHFEVFAEFMTFPETT